MKTFKEMGIDSFPLHWPPGWKRTNDKKASHFSGRLTLGKARDLALHELRLLGCGDWNVVISSNLALRRDGLPYSGLAQPKDVGIAVYFRLSDKPMVFACDTYRSVEENLHAIAKTIEALRGIKRWGASDMMERSFTGFAALPPPQAKRDWWEVLGVKRGDHPDRIKEAHRNLSKTHHPDRGGDPVVMSEINAAYEESLK